MVAATDLFKEVEHICSLALVPKLPRPVEIERSGPYAALAATDHPLEHWQPR